MAQSTADTAGLKWAPDTGPNSRISTPSPNTVVSEFCSSCSPLSVGDSCWAAMPEPMTTATSSPVPRNSASSRRASGATTARGRCWSISGMGEDVHVVEKAPDAAFDVVTDGPHRGHVEPGGVVDSPVEVAVAGEHGAGVAAAHGDDDVGGAHHLVGPRLGVLARDVDAAFGHGLDRSGVDLVGGVGATRP